MGTDASRREIRSALQRHGGVLRLRDHPDLRRAILHLSARGLLAAAYPGVYVAAGLRNDTDVRICAAALWRPDAVVIGRAAARVSFWDGLAVPVVELALPHAARSRPGVRFVQRVVPAPWRCHYRGVMMTSPPLTAVDLITDLGGAAISTALNRGVRLEQLEAALDEVPGRRGNRARRRMLRDYRGCPWSEAEQEVHRLMRSAGIRGWVANCPLFVLGGWHPIDVVFDELKVAIEIDGYAFHGRSAETRERYELDRAIASELVARGWRVLRFTWRQLTEQPDWVIATIRDALSQARRHG